MSSLPKIVALLFVLLWLAACSDDDSSGEVVLRIDENGEEFSPIKLEGSVEYLPSMKPEAVRVVRLDNKLYPVDSFELSIESNYMDKYSFRDGLRDYETPYIKVVTVFPSEKKNEKMEFVQYVRLGKDNTKLKQNFFAALAAERIEKLVRDKKYSFAEAEDSAMAALGVVFDMDLNGVNERKYDGLGTYGYYGDLLKDMKPYVYCRHEISDSIFYSDFKKFRKTFAEKGTVDSTWIIKAADTWLSTFEILVDSADYLFKSASRDTVDNLVWLDQKFFSRAYGVDFALTAGAQNVVAIKEKKSAFYGRSFINDQHRKSGLVTSRWRLQSALEDSLGPCLYDQFYYYAMTEKFIQRRDTLYVCRGDYRNWEVITERDSLINHQYGECSMNRNMGMLLYVHDSLFACLCEGNRCTWSDKYVDSVFTKEDAWYESVLDAKATNLYGKCTYENSGKMQKLDSLYVECSGNKWNPIDSLLYYLGHCSSDNYRGKHNDSYYSCQGKWPDIGDTTWHEIYPPEYYNDECELNRIVEYDSSYYICERLECEGDGCFAFRTWRKLEDAELIPPVVNMDTCEGPQQNLKIVYDGVFYECKEGRWRTVPKESLSPPEKEGLVCNDSLFGEIKRSGNDYFRCDSDFFWKKLIQKDALPLLYRDSLGECDTIANKILHWNENKSTFVGCATLDSVYEWHTISVGTLPYSLPTRLDHQKLAGGDITGPVYEATVDGIRYRFDINKYSSSSSPYSVILRYVDIGEKEYGAYLYYGHLFLHDERGTDSVLLSSIQEKSASFDDFYEGWKKRISNDCRCGGEGIKVEDSDVSVRFYNENTFASYEKGKAFCPKGFHIPDTTEFLHNFKYGTTIESYRNDSPIIWKFVIDPPRNMCQTSYEIYADVFWTSTEKDSETQYCCEIAMVGYTDEKVRRIVECPKDLYPMVQVLCAKDE